MLSHDSHALKCHSHTHSISIAIARLHYNVGAPHDDFFLHDFCFTSIVEPAASSCFDEHESPVLTAWKSYHMH